MNNNQKPNILIVEDDFSIAELVKDLLNDELNCQVKVVSNGKIALEVLKEREINLLILDIGLPGMSGLQIYDWVKANYNAGQLPIMFMTAQTTLYQHELDKRHIKHIIYKPFELDEFLAMVNCVLAENVAVGAEKKPERPVKIAPALKFKQI